MKYTEDMRSSNYLSLFIDKLVYSNSYTIDFKDVTTKRYNKE